MTGRTIILVAMLAALPLFRACAPYRLHCVRCDPVFGTVPDTLSAPALRYRSLTVTWDMNNVLFASSDRSLNKFKNFDESTMTVSATLFDDALIRAIADSIGGGDPAAAESSLTAYRRRHAPDDLVRIRVTLRAYFARRSIDPGIWTMYLVDENGDMYEPEKVEPGPPAAAVTVPAVATGYAVPLPRYRTEFDIYFKKMTFYGQPLIGPGRRYLKLVFAHNRQVAGGGGWCFGPER